MKKYRIIVSGHTTVSAFIKDLPRTEFFLIGTIDEGIDFYHKVTALLYKGKAERVEFIEIEDQKTKQ